MRCHSSFHTMLSLMTNPNAFDNTKKTKKNAPAANHKVQDDLDALISQYNDFNEGGCIITFETKVKAKPVRTLIPASINRLVKKTTPLIAPSCFYYRKIIIENNNQYFAQRKRKKIKKALKYNGLLAYKKKRRHSKRINPNQMKCNGSPCPVNEASKPSTYKLNSQSFFARPYYQKVNTSDDYAILLLNKTAR